MIFPPAHLSAIYSASYLMDPLRCMILLGFVTSGCHVHNCKRRSRVLENLEHQHMFPLCLMPWMVVILLSLSPSTNCLMFGAAIYAHHCSFILLLFLLLLMCFLLPKLYFVKHLRSMLYYSIDAVLFHSDTDILQVECCYISTYIQLLHIILLQLALHIQTNVHFNVLNNLMHLLICILSFYF